jgi:hypothetical protein
MPRKHHAVSDYPEGADRRLLKELDRKAQAERAALFRAAQQQFEREARLRSKALARIAGKLPVMDKRTRDALLADWSKVRKEARAPRMVDVEYHGREPVAQYLGCRVPPFPGSFVEWTKSPSATANARTGKISWQSEANSPGDGSMRSEMIWAGFEVWCYTPGTSGTLVCKATATASAAVSLSSWQPGSRASAGLHFRAAIQVGIPPLDSDADIYPYTAITIGADARFIGPRTYEVTVKYPLGNTFYPGGPNPYRRFWCGLAGHCGAEGLASASVDCEVRVREMCWHVE